FSPPSTPLNPNLAVGSLNTTNPNLTSTAFAASPSASPLITNYQLPSTTPSSTLTTQPSPLSTNTTPSLLVSSSQLPITNYQLQLPFPRYHRRHHRTKVSHNPDFHAQFP